MESIGTGGDRFHPALPFHPGGVFQQPAKGRKELGCFHPRMAKAMPARAAPAGALAEAREVQ